MRLRRRGSSDGIGEGLSSAEEDDGPAVFVLTGRGPGEALKAPARAQDVIDLPLEHDCLREHAGGSTHPSPPSRLGWESAPRDAAAWG